MNLVSHSSYSQLMTKNCIPIIDIFAGPGGLGEGFSSLRNEAGHPVFQISLSIEKDTSAHETLTLRSFFRQFADGEVPENYYKRLRREISTEELFERHPEQAAAAQRESWCATLGEQNILEVDRKIRATVEKAARWVLIGGPPCQAYSVVGRSRSAKKEKLSGSNLTKGDERVFLYEEYLRIIAVHLPDVFIMENVTGLLSSKIEHEYIFDNILTDLSRPGEALVKSGKGQAETYTSKGYHIYSLVTPPMIHWRDRPYFDHKDFIIKSELYGIPQTRHRVILLGIREDLTFIKPDVLKPAAQVSLNSVIGDLPALRSDISDKWKLKAFPKKSRKQEVDPCGFEWWQEELRIRINENLLDSIAVKTSEEVSNYIKEAVKSLKKPVCDKGAEFIAGSITVDYEAEWFLDEKIGGVCNHSVRTHMWEDLVRYLFASAYARLHGTSPKLNHYPEALLPNHRNVTEERTATKRMKFNDRFRVQLPDKPASTVTSHISKDGHYFIHYDTNQCRSLTVREAARIQTFPDNYLFCGTRSAQYVQVGNAVPPLLAKQIAEVVLDFFQRMDAANMTEAVIPNVEVANLASTQMV